MNNNTPVLYVVVPCFNEQAVIGETADRLSYELRQMMIGGGISHQSRILFVDDGSTDSTWDMITSLFADNEFVCGQKLAHNRGHQNALLAGLMTAKNYADCVISMDADLQDDPAVIPKFVAKYIEGCDVVYGVRSDRESDSVFKRSSAGAFYRVMKMLGAETVNNHADYRLMSKRAIEALASYDESNLFLRGIIPDIGFKSDIVYYKRRPRFAGSSKYPLRKMVSFAVDGITSFSVKPLKIISNLGIIISALSVIGLLYALISKLCGVAVTGWTAIIASIWLLGGIILLCLGIIGTYIGKIFGEVKHRPKYITETFLKK